MPKNLHIVSPKCIMTKKHIFLPISALEVSGYIFGIGGYKY